MHPKQTLLRFFRQHGCVMRRVDGGETRGILTRIHDPGVASTQVAFDRLGFTVKREYLLVAPPQNNGVLSVGARVRVGKKLLHLVAVDETVYADEPLCARAYAYQIREERP